MKINTELDAVEEDVLRGVLRDALKANNALTKMVQATPHEIRIYEDKAQTIADLMIKLNV